MLTGESGNLATERRSSAERRGCVQCIIGENLAAHYITPIEAGGPGDWKGLAVLCRSWHHDAHDGAAVTASVVYNPDSFWGWIDSE